MKKEFPQIRQNVCKECFWSQSYCLLTVGGTLLKVLNQYIETRNTRTKRMGGDDNVVESKI
ncbi:transposase [Bacillus sp. NPDC077411]|uniref:transposase n=1 Tax=Bacillus sp. NPDC077411 TaxID=3363947 RepID=UPI0037CCA798